jgi:ribosome-binding factor A
MATGNRAQRVGDQILKVIASFLLQKVKDPRVEGVTLTGVRVSKDLKMAKVYFSVLGEDKDIRNATDGLESARGFIKRELGSRLDLRVMPDIQFLYDESFERGLRIERLLEDLRRTAPHGNGSLEERFEIKGKDSSDDID